MANGNYGGSGTANDPYIIEDAFDFDVVRKLLYGGKHAKLVADIDLNIPPFNDGNWNGSNLQNAVFDGNGYCIKNLYTNYQGSNTNHPSCLFYNVTNATVKNLILDNFNMRSTKGLYGSPLALNLGYQTSLINVHVKNSYIRGGASLGGLVNVINTSAYDDIRIIGCSVTDSDLYGGIHMGGIIGFCFGNLTMDYCYTKINMYSNNPETGITQAGGMIGWTGFNYVSGRDMLVDVSNCRADIIIPSTNINVGGIIGLFDFQEREKVHVNNCIVTGTISTSLGAQNQNLGIGGIAGMIRGAGTEESAQIRNCVSALDRIEYNHELPEMPDRAFQTVGRVSGMYNTTVRAVRDCYAYDDMRYVENGSIDHRFQNSAWNENGTGVSYSTLLDQSFYESIGFNFGINKWVMEDGHTIPIPHYCDRDPLPFGEPYTTSKALVLVEEDIFGTMEYDGTIWRYIRAVERSDKDYGDEGESITYDYYGDKVEIDGLVYRFLASGIRDTESCGGYGYYTDETMRTIPFLNNMENVVNFYYVLDEPSSSLNVQGFHDRINIAVSEERSKLMIIKPDGSLGYIPLVPLDDPEASKVRIMTENGVKALKEV